MKAVLSIVVVLLVFLLQSAWGESRTIKGEARDSSGKLISKTYTKGNVTETRDPMGKLVTKSKTTNGKTEVRSPTGKLLYKAK